MLLCSAIAFSIPLGLTLLYYTIMHGQYVYNIPFNFMLFTVPVYLYNYFTFDTIGLCLNIMIHIRI